MLLFRLCVYVLRLVTGSGGNLWFERVIPTGTTLCAVAKLAAYTAAVAARVEEVLMLEVELSKKVRNS
jgi:hypothetical protein